MTSDNIGSRARRGAFWSVAAQALAALLSLLTFAVLSKYAGPSEFGQFVLATTIVASVQWLALNAYREPLIQAPALDAKVASSAFWFSVLVTLALAVLSLAAAACCWLIWRERALASCVAVLSLKLAAETLASVPAALRARELDFALLARAAIAGSMLGSLLSILLLTLGWGITGMAVGQSVGALAALLVLMVRANWRPELHFRSSDLSVYRDYSPHVITWQAVEVLNNNFDRFFVALRLSVPALGVYGFARRLNEIAVQVLVGAVANVSLPAFAALQHDKARLRSSFLRSVQLLTFLVMPVIATLFATADELIAVAFGEQWITAVPVYRCFLVLGLTQTVGILQATLIRSVGQAKLWSRYMLVQTLANVVVVFFAIEYGVVVLAAAIVARSYVIWCWAIWKTCSLVDMQVSLYLGGLARTAGLAAAGAAAGWLASHTLHDALGAVRLLVAVATSAAVYGALSALFLRSSWAEARTLLGRS